MPVYVIRNEANGLYKIGRTTSIRERLLTLMKEEGSPTRLCCLIATNNNIRLEWELHRRFAARHVRGEWFALSPEDLAAVRVIAVVNYKDDAPVRWRPADCLNGNHKTKYGVRRFHMAVGDVVERIRPPRNNKPKQK